MPGGRAPSWALILTDTLILMLSLAPTASVKADPLRLERTDPAHFGAPVLAPIETEPLPEHPLSESARVVYRLPERVTRWAKSDARLSHLCQRGAFRQAQTSWFYAHTPEKMFGVAFGEGANLHDPQHLAKPATVYFFEQADTARCEVYVAGTSAVAAYAVAGTPGAPTSPPTGR